ncbi:hypothetical protein [Pseudomonas sp. NPDC096950]|uniref:hypothetical protein n=1 Tax=Pseudomonas sp. NPDC096950 TaxID=3364485 RepID=UPI00383A33D2
MRKSTTTTLIALALLSQSAVTHAETGTFTERDECVSQLRGIAELNAAKGGYAIVKMDAGEFSSTPEGGVKCSTRFLTVKDGKGEFSKTYSAEVQAYPAIHKN